MKISKIGKIPCIKDLNVYLKRRVVPVRFCYPGKGGDRWHELACSDIYELKERELTALKNSLLKVKEVIGNLPINLVHIGPGDGIEMPCIFGIFTPNRNKRYVGVDISRQMLCNTYRLKKSYFSDIHPLWYLTDVETEGNLERVCAAVRKRGANRNLILCTAQGVLLSNPKTLENLYNAMQHPDYLFITIEGDDVKKREEICATYNLSAVKALLSVGLKRAGYEPEKGAFKTSFNKKKSTVEVYFKPVNEKEILCLTSYKPQEGEFRRRLEKFGFSIEFLIFYEDIHTFAVLCKKRREDVQPALQ